MFHRATPLLLCLALAGGGLAACGDDESPAVTDQPAATSQAGGDVVTIAMKDILYKPENADVKVGQTVVWPNQDPISHTVTATSGASFDSGDVKGGASFQYTPEKPGKIEYFCKIHPNQKGSLNVTE